MGGLAEILGGIILVVIPEPATTTLGWGVVVDGIKRVADEISNQ